MARREVETAVLRGWAAGRLRCGLAAFLRQVGRSQWSETLRARAVSARRRLLVLKGLGALDVAILRAAEERDLAAEAEAARARAALRRWQRRAEESRVRAAARAKQVGIRQWATYFFQCSTFYAVLTVVGCVFALSW